MAQRRTKEFFESGTSAQFEWILSLYDQCLRLKAENKSSKPENVIKLDKWYQNELPRKIKSRGKDAHLTHEELVQTIKWKLARGKFRPNLTNLIQMNTPRVVMQETKKAFRNISKKEDVIAASSVLCNLKGVGPAMASAVLAAGAPHLAPFMADECLLAMPDVDSLDYTMREYMSFVEHIKNCVTRLNGEGGDWNPHKVELAIWTHYVANDLKPELLNDLPSANPAASAAVVAPEPVEPVEKAETEEPKTEDTEGEQPAEPTSNGPTVEEGSAAPDEPKGEPEKINSDEAKANDAPVPSATNGNSCKEENNHHNGQHNATTNGDGTSSKEDSENSSDSKTDNQTTDTAVTNGVESKRENGTEKLSDETAPEDSITPKIEAVTDSSEVTKRAMDGEESSPAAKKLKIEETAPEQPVA